MILGFIGFGEAAYEMASGLKGEGFSSMIAFDKMMEDPAYGRLIRERAQQADVKLTDSPEALLKAANIVMVAVPADQAYAACESLKPYLKKGAIYVDVSASSPDTKERIWRNIQATGVSFVDAAMLGSLTVYKHKVPILASGSGTDSFMEAMAPYGMKIEKISSEPGQASAVKLLRSICMKGLAALLVEVLEAADAYNVADRVMASVRESLEKQPFDQLANQLVTGTAIHALRRAHELEGSIEMLGKAGIDAAMAEASRKKLNAIASLNLREKFGGERPADWKAVIQMIHAGKGILYAGEE